MEVLSFDIKGKFAHFRKFHGNNTALTYSIPPRTTIMGMLANILGAERDSYYENLSSENLRIGIRVMSEIKKTFHRLNFLKIVSMDDFTGQKGRVQTPFEVVTAEDIRSGWVTYRIYLGPGKDRQYFSELKNALEQSDQKFNLSLGTANFSATISDIRYFPDVTEKRANDEWIHLHSACNSDQVLEISFSDDSIYKFNHLEEELMPADFKSNNDRELKGMNRILLATTPFPIHALLTGTYYTLGENENIQFLEYADVLSQQK